MSEAHRRQKQPAVVRRVILDTAVRLAASGGLATVPIQDISAASGVTKGGLLHHFPTKQALVEAVFADLLDRLDAAIESRMGDDPDPRGAFTRAYVQAIFDDEALGPENPWAAISATMISDPDLRRQWSVWIEARLERHAATDRAPIHDVVRLAADGCWLAFLLTPDGPAAVDAVAMRERLLELTRV